MLKQTIKKILILEDDAELAKSLRNLLKTKLQAYVQIASTVDQCLELIDTKPFDILIADWLLADNETGLEAITYAREYHYQLKVLMLTCQKSVDHRLHAYRQGADAYLAKPFHPEELLIKIDQLFNQYKLCDGDAITFKGIALYPQVGQILIDQQAVEMGAKEVKILKLLIVNQSRVLSKQKILDLIWTDLDHQPGLNTVEVYIRRIRQKLGPYKKYLRNKRGFGYWLDNGKVQ
jgi:two-component system, OmpR family, response regulator CiaR